MKRFIRWLAYLTLGMSSLILFKLRGPYLPLLYTLKVLAGGIAPVLAVVGGLTGLLGLLRGDRRTAAAGVVGATLAGQHVQRTLNADAHFEAVFGADWALSLTPEQTKRMLSARWSLWLLRVPQARFEQDVVFYTIPETGRELLCDLWQPSDGVRRTGLAVIYFHGSAWHYMDKDIMTRPFFRHLVAQGHVVMDVAYRLAPETDIHGMVADVKHAVAWLKHNGARYGVNPERIVLAGGSAGGHLALLAAYTPDDPALTPDDLRDVDLSVCGVLSYYGTTDLCETYHGAVDSFTLGRPGTKLVRTALEITFKLLGVLRADQTLLDGPLLLENVLGGRPADLPDIYALASPLTYVRADCPPTLLIQGEHDWMVSVEQVRALYQALLAAGAPAAYLELPQTDHAFDLFLLPVSPAAQTALYHVERFLALLV